MARRVPMLAVLAIVCAIATPGFAGEELIFAGSYVWERTEETMQGELEVLFTPVDEGEWTLAFHFDWEGEAHVFEGTASGSLSGELTGTAASDDPGHPLKFEFEGVFTDGVFSGTHGYFNHGGDLVYSGTLELTPAG